MNIWKCLAVLCATVLSFTPVSSQASGEGQPDAKAVVRAHLEKSIAPIRSAIDLENHLASSVGKTSPLDVMDPDKKSAFLASLVFTEHGVAALRHDLLSGLTAFEAHRILGLFGWQNRTAAFPGLLVATPIDKSIIDLGGVTESGPECLILKSECTGFRYNKKCQSVEGGWGYSCDRCACIYVPN